MERVSANTHLTVTPPITGLTPRITSVPIPTTPQTPSSPSGLARCCPRCTHLRSGVLIFMTFIAVVGFAGSLITPDLPNQKLFAAAFAVLALGCMYFTKDALDREKQLNNLAADRLLVQAQLQNTEQQLEGAQKRLERVELELEEERRKIETAVTNLGGKVNDLGVQNNRLEHTADRLDGSVDRLQEILEKKHGA